MSLGGSGMYFTTGVILLVAVNFRLLLVEVLDSGLDIVDI